MRLQLELPLEDNQLSGEEDDVFTSENHLFDFSTVNILPLEEYRRIAEDSDICPPNIKIANKHGYQLTGECKALCFNNRALFLLKVFCTTLISRRIVFPFAQYYMTCQSLAAAKSNIVSLISN